jgi:4-hydroxyphenylacetate 3-monooxygenase
MIRTGDEYRDSIRDGREICVKREKLADVTTYP